MEQWFWLLRSRIDDLDSELQQRLYRSYHRFVYKDIYLLVRDHPLTEDIIQESFMKIITYGPTTKYSTNLKSWIMRVARNTAFDWLRKNKKDRRLFAFCSPHPMEWTHCAYTNVAEEVELKERDALLHQALHELKPEYRTLLTMYYLEEKTYKEISRELHVTEQVITQRLARARKKLLQHFSRKWGEHGRRSKKR
ncbi:MULTISPECIES: RNA polymerase sigma factor [unclassified Paenibacillus]|uniref:RNA polymerase sigma factor n=1 Tax=unclassified Paenibacillus TaxID=185978 RepID=UPI0002E2AA42|nr:MULTISPECIES: sigma-70 family RNA polymerase sigma factor [unclassified Paenibacillus]MCM3337709.1 sigma-70 family RNA polymerase sigma factor [Paenibacillus sp. MER TA 81-3]